MNRHKVAADFKRVTVQLNEMKRSVAKQIADTIDDRGLTQTEAAFLMKDAPSQVSLVVTGKLRGFSAERLLRMLAMLGNAVEITITTKSRPSIRKVA